MCRSVEARDDNVLWEVGVEDFFVCSSEIRMNKNAIKINNL